MRTGPLYILGSPTINFRRGTKYNTYCWELLMSDTRTLQKLKKLKWQADARGDHVRPRPAGPSVQKARVGDGECDEVHRCRDSGADSRRRRRSLLLHAGRCTNGGKGSPSLFSRNLWRPVDYKDFFFGPRRRLERCWPVWVARVHRGRLSIALSDFHIIASQKDRRVRRARVEPGPGPLS